jgi:hypothetical protein
MTLELDRRQLLRLGFAAAVAWELAPWVPAVGATAAPQPVVDITLEAFADTLIPGQKRYPGDRAVAGAAKGAGAVQAGALAFMRFPPVGVAPLLPAFAAAVNAEALTYAAQQRLVLDPTVPPFVALDFTHRTRLAVQLLDFSRPDYLLYYALAALAFLAFHTAGHLHTADAVRSGHPGLKRLGFPRPDADGLWRFPNASYHRRLARNHPGTTRTGHPT